MNVLDVIKLFNENNSSELFSYICDEFFPDRKKCRECGGEIIYKNTRIRIKLNGTIEIIGKSFNTIKTKGERLEVCENCINEKFTNHKLIKADKIFNTCNEITIWAFNIKDKDAYKTGVTLNKLINKYGIEDGNKRWESYKEKQSKSNTFEYKEKKYGWDKEQFNNFNLSRAITLENLIKKYGEEIGKQKWDIYIQKQKETKSFSYMVSKFGLEKTKEINSSKSLSLNNYIKRLGEEQGIIEFEKHLNKLKTSYSIISQKIFNDIDIFLKDKYTTFYATKNYEYSINTKIGVKCLDYYIKELNICIEFNGDVFHANEKLFLDNDKPNPFNKELTAKHIRDRDKERYDILYKNHNIKTIVIWESDYNKYFDINKFLKDNGILF